MNKNSWDSLKRFQKMFNDKTPSHYPLMSYTHTHTHSSYIHRYIIAWRMRVGPNRRALEKILQAIIQRITNTLMHAVSDSLLTLSLFDWIVFKFVFPRFRSLSFTFFCSVKRLFIFGVKNKWNEAHGVGPGERAKNFWLGGGTRNWGGTERINFIPLNPVKEWWDLRTFRSKLG